MEVLCNTLSIQERCVLFLNLVITKAALFNTHYEAYLHVKNCMTEIEEVYAQNLSAEHTLRMGSLDAFNTCEVAGIYWWKSNTNCLYPPSLSRAKQEKNCGN